jgi:hypothetical protein
MEDEKATPERKSPKVLIYGALAVLLILAVSGRFGKGEAEVTPAQLTPPAETDVLPAGVDAQGDDPAVPPVAYSPTEDELDKGLDELIDLGSEQLAALVGVRADAYSNAAKRSRAPMVYFHKTCGKLIDDYAKFINQRGSYSGNAADADRARWMAVDSAACLVALRRVRKGLPNYTEETGAGLSPKEFLDRARVAVNTLGAAEQLPNQTPVEAKP